LKCSQASTLQLITTFHFLSFVGYVGAVPGTRGAVTKYAVDAWHCHFHIGLLGTQKRMVNLSFDQSTIMVLFEEDV